MKCAITIVSIIAFSCAGVALAERNANFRIFRNGDGLKESSVTGVSVSSRGNVWARHLNADEISVLDGYSVRAVPAPGRELFRVYESEAGHVWTPYSDGLAQHDGRRWIRHVIPEIQAEVRAHPMVRIVRQIPLIPLQRDRVLFLLSDRLFLYDALRSRTSLLKVASDAEIGTFTEMTEARAVAGRQRGVWITGTQGMGRLSWTQAEGGGPVDWLEMHRTTEMLGAENLQRPFESSVGVVFVVASDINAESKRVILRYDAPRWSKHPIQSDNIRHAWPGWEGTVWAFTVGSLLRFDDVDDLSASKERVLLGRFNDVAIETNGVFWLAAAEGLIRYAPPTWRTPPECVGMDGMVHAIVEDRDGRLWFASTDGLASLKGQEWRRFSWPEGFEPDFQTTDGVYQLPNGTLTVSAREQSLLFDPGHGTYRTLRHPEGRKIKLLGNAENGTVWAQTWNTGGDANSARIEQFDGVQFVTVLNSAPDYDLSADLSFVREAQNGDLWLGGNSGLAVWRHGQWQTFGESQGFPYGRVTCWIETAEGKIWCGTETQILEFNGVKWTPVHSQLDRVNGMLKARNGRVWVATGDGLYCASDGSWVANGVDEGLASDFVTEVFEDRQGHLWAGTIRGMSRYYPSADVDPPKTRRPILNTTGKPRADAPIALSFDGMDRWHHTPADRLLYKYRLNEGPWSPYTSAAVHTFEQMPAGKYRIEVRAMDRNWNEAIESAFLEFVAVMPWYKESRLIIVLMIGAALVIFFAAVAVNRHIQLIHSYAEVEKIVAVRTKELERANRELLQSQKMRALGTLAAGIAHDFNNILSIIKGSAQIIECNMEDRDKVRTRLNRINSVVDQGAGIVKSMLGLSRAREQDLAPMDLNGIVDETLKLLGDRFLHEVTVRFEASHSIPRVMALKELVQQMLLNLILNASDAMSGVGEVVIRTGAMRELPADLALSPSSASEYAYISVHDSGCGVDPELMPRIFEPFFTTKALSSRRGTGLGLSMVYQLAKEMGYGLKVESTVGQGSSFTILFPA